MLNNYSVSVVIPNFCGKTLLEKYLPSVIEALHYASCVSLYEIIVVDDASTDDSVIFLKESYPEIKLFSNEQNSGFSKTINKGIFAASFDYVLLLNSDMQLPLSFFKELNVDALFQEDFFGIFPSILDSNGANTLESQKLPRLKFGVISYKDVANESLLSNSIYLCGGCALVCREKLLAINAFDTIYSPFYYEDLDLSLRAWKHGWKSYYTPITHAVHCHSATVNGYFSKDFVRTVFIRNKLIVNYLHTSGLHRITFYLNIFLKLLVSIFIPTKSKQLFLKGFIGFIKMHDVLKERRKQTQVDSLLSISQILSNYF